MQMPDKQLDKEAIITALAKELPDADFAALFPGLPVKELRAVLLGKKKTAAPQQEQQQLFKEPVATDGLSCRLFTDGASRGNPGQAGAGSVLLDSNGQEIAGRSLYLGRCTNNVAEYRALILGLQTAAEFGCSQLDIFLDSQLIVRQVLGQYKVKHPDLKPLFQEVKSLLAGVDNWKISHVPRAENKRADELANRGIDNR